MWVHYINGDGFVSIVNLKPALWERHTWSEVSASACAVQALACMAAQVHMQVRAHAGKRAGSRMLPEAGACEYSCCARVRVSAHAGKCAGSRVQSNNVRVLIPHGVKRHPLAWDRRCGWAAFAARGCVGEQKGAG